MARRPPHVSPAEWAQMQAEEELRRGDARRLQDELERTAPREAAPDSPPYRANRLAVTAFTLSCVGWFGTWLPGMVLGFVAWREIEESGGAERGDRLAKWAIALGLLGFFEFVFLVIALAKLANG